MLNDLAAEAEHCLDDPTPKGTAFCDRRHFLPNEFLGMKVFRVLPSSGFIPPLASDAGCDTTVEKKLFDPIWLPFLNEVVHDGRNFTPMDWSS